MASRKICPSPTGRAWIELDMAALRHNAGLLQSLLPQSCQLMPAVKANAYGHGAVLIARELNRAGIQSFCVATAQEGAELREHGVTGEMLVLGYTHPNDFPLLGRYDLTQSIPDLSYAVVLDACGGNIKSQIKIDTGMHRLGVRWDRPEEITRIFDCRNLRITGVFTHLSSANSNLPQDRAVTLAQNRAFHNCISELQRQGYTISAVHLLASGGILNYPELGGDYARPGIALYGMLSDRRDQNIRSAGLRPVLSLKARVAQVRELMQGEGAGYNLKFTAHRNCRLAVLAIGYGDGLPRSLSCGVGAVLIHGRKAPIAGRICMDQTLVDVTDIPDVSPGDAVTLIGQNGGAEITVYDLAEQAGTITNEILSQLGTRLERLAK